MLPPEVSRMRLSQQRLSAGQPQLLNTRKRQLLMAKDELEIAGTCESMAPGQDGSQTPEECAFTPYCWIL
jgi:hypothetical protein